MYGAILKILTLTGIILILSNSDALASSSDETLGIMIRRTVDGMLGIENAIAFFFFSAGALFIGYGLKKTHDHTVNGPQSVELAEPIKYFMAGGTMIALPAMTSVIAATTGAAGDAQEINNLGWNMAALGEEGDTTLTSILFNFIGNIYGPAQYAIMFFCYIAGIILAGIVCYRVTKTSQEKAQGPIGLGTIFTFILAGILFSIPPMIGTIAETMFGGRTSMNSVEFLALDASLGEASGMQKTLSCQSWRF